MGTQDISSRIKAYRQHIAKWRDIIATPLPGIILDDWAKQFRKESNAILQTQGWVDNAKNPKAKKIEYLTARFAPLTATSVVRQLNSLTFNEERNRHVNMYSES